MLLGIAAAAGAAAAGACVRIETGPNGVQSMRLDGTSPSVVAGDVLRDSLGRPAALAAATFGENGDRITTAPVRYVYFPALRDSLGRLSSTDTAIVVDSVTGATRATRPFTAQRGVLAAALGDRLLVADTVDIVPTPDSAVLDSVATDTLRYICTDTTSQTLALLNAVGPYVLRVSGDSLGVRAPAIRRRLVRWTLDSAPQVPAYRLPRGGPADTVAAISIIFNASDRQVRFDTTDAAGRSRVRLRIRPPALGSSVIPARTFQVRLRADVQPGPVPITGGTQFVRVTLQRVATPPAGQPVTCQ